MLLSWSSPVVLKLNNITRIDENPMGRVLSESEISWIGSLVNLGAMIIPFLAGYISEKIGRKYALILNGVPYITSALLLAFCTEVGWYYFARILGGAALGATFTLVPVYIAEISEKHIRGVLGSIMNIFVTLGMLASFAIGPYISIMWFSVVCAAVPLLFVIMSILLPESPYYLVKKENVEEALNVMKKTRFDTNPDGMEKDLEEMKHYVSLGTKGSLSDIFASRVAIRAMVICGMLMIFQQLCGVNSITFYAESLFAQSGSTTPPEISSIIFGAAQASSTFFTPFFVDSFGRKILLVISAVGMLITETALGVYFYLKEDGQDVNGIYWMPILCLTVFIAIHNLAYAGLPWVITAEIFPESVRYVGTTSITCFNWFLSFLMTLLFAPLSDAVGMSGSFFLFSACNVVAIVCVTLYVPETKGKSFQEIQDMLEQQQSKKK